jgi:hypothetical protein
MTNQNERDSASDRMSVIDEAKYLLSGRSPSHPRATGQSPTPDEVANSVVDMFYTYAEVDATAEQRIEAARVVRTLPDDDTTMERFVKNCEGSPLLTILAQALQQRIEGPWRLL